MTCCRWWELEKERVMANYFAKADLKKEDKIKSEHLLLMFEANGIKMEEEELKKIGELADSEGKISRENYWEFLWKCQHWNGKLSEKEKVNLNHVTIFLDKRLKTEAVLRELRFEERPLRPVTAKKSKAEKMDEIFRVFDKDKDGKISREEFIAIEPHLTKEQTESVMKMFQTSTEGKLGRKDFEEALKKKKQ